MICLGCYQVFHAIGSYLVKEKPETYYYNLSRYGFIVATYFIIWTIAYLLPVEWLSAPGGTQAVITYCICIPHFIAIHYWCISTEEHYEELEKLIF